MNYFKYFMNGSNIGIVTLFFRPGEIIIEYEESTAEIKGKRK